MVRRSSSGRSVRLTALAWLLGCLLLPASGAVWAQQAPKRAGATPQAQGSSDRGVQLDFNDVELPVVIDTIARLTGHNFIYDDRVRGRVTIVSPTRIPVNEAYAVFESVLQVKGYTTVPGPGGTTKIVPLRDATESNVETLEGRAPTPKSDRFVTRLIPLQYIDAAAITTTLKPLVSKDASMVAYEPTNTVILTDAASNITRILKILRAIDVETYKEELTVIHVQHADASTLANQLSEIFGAEVQSTSQPGNALAAAIRARRAAQQGGVGGLPASRRGTVRIITDERTNSLVILSPRQQLTELRNVIRRLDVPVTGGGRIHVYYLKYADAEDLAPTLTALISGQPVPTSNKGGQHTATTPANVQALKATVSGLSEGVTVTADAPTNSLVIQASQEGYRALTQVIQQLDIPRPEVLVEALVLEVDITNNQNLGFSGLVRLFTKGNQYAVGSLTDSGLASFLPPSSTSTSSSTTTSSASDLLGPILTAAANATASSAAPPMLAAGSLQAGGTLIQGIIRASASLSGANIVSAPHILTMDNEEAEIKVGNNIPIPTSRVSSAAGVSNSSTLATQVNIERQDIGLDLRVTPQISEGDNLRLKIFQEIKNVNQGLTKITGNAQDVGVALSNRSVDNTVVVKNGETVVIGGLISDDYQPTSTKVPWLGDIPILGWLFKTTSTQLQKQNLLIFLTPHIIRTAADMEYQTIRKREEFWNRSEEGIQLTEKQRKERAARRQAEAAAGVPPEPPSGRNPVQSRLEEMSSKWPIERMRELEKERKEEREKRNPKASQAPASNYGVLAATYGDAGVAKDTLQKLLDAGYDGALVSRRSGGTVLYEVRLGPFKNLDAANQAAGVLRASYQLAPTVFVEEK